jgi:hypothetical protein
MTNGKIANNKVNTWSVVILVISIFFFAAGLIFGVVKESIARSIATIALEVKTTTARVDILEREFAVFSNELRHINIKLDDIGSDIKEQMD